MSATNLDEQLDQIFEDRDRTDMSRTIAALLPLLDQHPLNPRVLYEVGGAYDTAGEEATAVGFYERAMRAGLEGDLRRRCALQYGSTLRNLGRLDESFAVFAEARERFPESASLAVFEALTFHAAERHDAAVASLLATIAHHVQSADIDRYKPAIRGNAEFVASLDAS